MTTEVMVEANPDSDSASDSAREITSTWLQRLEQLMSTQDVSEVPELFIDNAWWRDLLALTWDLRSYNGHQAISGMLAEFLPTSTPRELAIEDGKMPTVSDATGQTMIESYFTATTEIARVRGILRLVFDDGAWKAWTIATSMTDLIGHEEHKTSIRDSAHDEHNTAVKNRPTWYLTRHREREFADTEPTVLIIGAGHSGLMLAARLQHMGVSHLVVDKEQRLGDNWRQRYSGLSLHDTCWFSRFPYLEYPDNWPLYTPAELMGDFIESYVTLLRLNAWVETTVQSAEYDADAKQWAVTVDRSGQQRVLRPTHLVFATGQAGLPNMPEIPGADKFAGKIVHSSAFTGGRDHVGERAIVVGTGSSGQDVAQSFYESGAEHVTIVQRGGTYVMSGRHGIPIFHGGLWQEDGPALDDADLQLVSFPYPVALTQLGPAATRAIAALDADMLDGLARVGFDVDLQKGDAGMLGAALNRGGGYYIDKGAAQLIIDGEVGLQRGEISEFTETGVVYSDGTREDADVVVFATGWSNMRDMVRPICGDEVTDRLTDVWGLDEYGELRGTFRQSGHPRLWFIAGSTGMVRSHSKHVALQILGVETGNLIQD